MSSSSNITGLLASLINGTTPSEPPFTSVANLNRVSFTTAYTNSIRQGENNRTTPSINATKKAIVLSHLDTTPTLNSQAGSGTDWYETMNDFLPSYCSEVATNAISPTGVGNYPKYRIWILPDNLNSNNLVPALSEGQVTNIDRFPLCSVKDTSITEELVVGALIRIDFEDRLLSRDAYVTNIMNNSEEFGRAIFTELAGIASPYGACLPCALAGPSVSHPAGDAVNGGDIRTPLHNAYSELYRAIGSNIIDKDYIYNRLNNALQNPRLSIGILANAIEESGLDSNVVSDHANRNGTESSIGLWQCNASNAGYVSSPNANIQSLTSKIPESIRIPISSRVIVYYAGGQLSKEKGVSIITPIDYARGGQDISQVYGVLSNSDFQIDYAIEVAKNMLATIPNAAFWLGAASDITSGNWAQWWQIYFEQPSIIHDRRMATAEAVALELGVV